MNRIRSHYSDKARLIGDFALLMIPVLVPIISNAPLSDNSKYWLNAILTIALVTAKFITKLWQGK